MAKTNVPNPDDNVRAAGAGSLRKSMGDGAQKFKNVSGAASPNTKTVKKTGSGKQGDAGLGSGGNRGPISAERLGPQFTVSASIVKQIDPSAGLTQANGRVVPPSVVRSRPSFDDERGRSY